MCRYCKWTTQPRNHGNQHGISFQANSVLISQWFCFGQIFGGDNFHFLRWIDVKIILSFLWIIQRESWSVDGKRDDSTLVFNPLESKRNQKRRRRIFIKGFDDGWSWRWISSLFDSLVIEYLCVFSRIVVLTFDDCFIRFKGKICRNECNRNFYGNKHQKTNNVNYPMINFWSLTQLKRAAWQPNFTISLISKIVQGTL